jgi:hypothetical protein
MAAAFKLARLPRELRAAVFAYLGSADLAKLARAPRWRRSEVEREWQQAADRVRARCAEKAAAVQRAVVRRAVVRAAPFSVCAAYTHDRVAHVVAAVLERVTHTATPDNNNTVRHLEVELRVTAATAIATSANAARARGVALHGMWFIHHTTVDGAGRHNTVELATGAGTALPFDAAELSLRLQVAPPLARDAHLGRVTWRFEGASGDAAVARLLALVLLVWGDAVGDGGGPPDGVHPIRAICTALAGALRRSSSFRTHSDSEPRTLVCLSVGATRRATWV